MLQLEFRISVSDNEESRDRVLKILLWALIALNLEYLKMNPRTPPLYRSGVRFMREREGEELWPTIGEVIKAGGGDCEDLAAWRVAELRASGIPARPAWRHRLVRMPSGQTATLYHILVFVPGRGNFIHQETGEKGGLEDPSRLLGMGRNEAD